MNRNIQCPVCNSIYTLFTQNVMGVRTKQFYPQLFCMDCQSFFHRSSYSESVEQKQLDFMTLLSEREIHFALMSQLALELKTRRPATHTVLEIGHGTGQFLRACENYGMQAHGFEVNEYCHKFAVENMGLSSEFGMFGYEHPEHL